MVLTVRERLAVVGLHEEPAWGRSVPETRDSGAGRDLRVAVAARRTTKTLTVVQTWDGDAD